jgi:RNA polymerase sigma factor (sigma-70 family)
MGESLRGYCSPEDIWQEALAHAWRDRAQHQWTGVRAFRAWLFEIARNRIHEATRSRGAQKRGGGRSPHRLPDSTAGDSSVRPVPPPADSVTPSRLYVRGERREAVEKALSELPPDLEPIVRLHLIEGLAMEAIAARVGIGVSAAWRRYRKGLELCARNLPGWAGEGSTGA